MLESFLTKVFEKKNRRILYHGHEIKPEEAASLDGGAIFLLMLSHKIATNLITENNNWIENIITIQPDDSNPNLFINGIKIKVQQTNTHSSIYPLLSLLQTSVDELCRISDDPNLIHLEDVNQFVSQGVLHELNINWQTFQEASQKKSEQEQQKKFIQQLRTR